MLFEGLLTIRVGNLILFLASNLAKEKNINQDEAYESLMELAPSEIQRRLREVMEQYKHMDSMVFKLETMRAIHGSDELTWDQNLGLEELTTPNGGWNEWRKYQGAINRIPDDFYVHLWRLFQYTNGLIIGDKLERRNRLDSHIILSEMTAGEKAFALRIEHLLNKINSAEYRYLCLEALIAISHFTEQNPTLKINDYIIIDVLIGHAVRLAYLDNNPEKKEEYNDHKVAAWTLFYESHPVSTAEYMVKSLQYLLDYENGHSQENMQTMEV